jgi:hypothetical protein
MIDVIAAHLWQSTLFGAAAALLTLAFRANKARVRYWIWLTASLKFLIPFVLLTSLGSHIHIRTPAQAPVLSYTVEYFNQPVFLRVAAPPAAAGRACTLNQSASCLRVGMRRHYTCTDPAAWVATHPAHDPSERHDRSPVSR